MRRAPLGHDAERRRLQFCPAALIEPLRQRACGCADVAARCPGGERGAGHCLHFRRQAHRGECAACVAQQRNGGTHSLEERRHVVLGRRTGDGVHPFNGGAAAAA